VVRALEKGVKALDREGIMMSSTVQAQWIKGLDSCRVIAYSDAFRSKKGIPNI
jgi:hypothetical protein